MSMHYPIPPQSVSVSTSQRYLCGGSTVTGKSTKTGCGNPRIVPVEIHGLALGNEAQALGHDAEHERRRHVELRLEPGDSILDRA